MGEAKRTILVHARKAGTGYRFSMSGYGVNREEIKCKKDGMNTSDTNTVIFEVANHGRADLRFPSDPDRAMWVGPDDQTCPGSQPPRHSEVVATNVSSNREQLTVENSNSTDQRYKFSLNFVEADDASERRLHQYDPIWDNRNGGAK